MTEKRSIEIQVGGVVDLSAAEKLVTRIRAVMRNEIDRIILIFDENTTICSAEFLAFLATSADYLEKRGREIVVQGVSSKNESLFKISKLEHLLESRHE